VVHLQQHFPSNVIVWREARERERGIRREERRGDGNEVPMNVWAWSPSPFDLSQSPTCFSFHFCAIIGPLLSAPPFSPGVPGVPGVVSMEGKGGWEKEGDANYTIYE